MPAIPETWLNDFITNTNPNGSQGDPVVTHLASGYILVTWTDFDNSSAPGSPAGSDIIGRIFDPFGNAVTAEFRVNTFGTVDHEQDANIVALANGGFMVVYEDNGTDNNILYETWNFNSSTFVVTQAHEGYILDDADGGNLPNSPVVASASATSAMTAYIVNNSDGSENVFVRAYNPSTNALQAAQQKLFGFTGTGESVGGIDLTALTNGNYVLAIANRNNGNDQLFVNILNSTGGTVTSVDVDTTGEITDPQVVALTGGGFAVTRNEGDSIFLRVFDSAGGAAQGTFLAETSGNSLNEPAIAALSDGGFIIVWDDDTTGQIRGSHFNVSGSSFVTTAALNFLIDDSGGLSITEIEAEGLADGRFVVTWNDGGNIRTKIMDVRDEPNSPGDYSPNQYQVGTIGNDNFIADFSSEVVHGWDGHDMITENGVIKEYYGGAGNDTLLAVSAINSDRHDGGSGIDMISWASALLSGVTFNLQTGTASTSSASEVMVGFENLTGSRGHDTIMGNGLSNVLNGAGGNDIISGGADRDFLFGEMHFGGSGSATKAFGLSNNTFQTAMWIAPNFGFLIDPEIENSDTNPRVSVTAAGDNTHDFYSFTVYEAGEIIIDIDHGRGDTPSGDLFDSVIHLFDANQTLLATSDDGPLDPGSVNSLDSRISFNVTTPGIYYVQVRAFGGGGVPSGSNYELQITLPHQFGGNDILNGEAGDDILSGQLGNDQIDGGVGSDMVMLAGLNGAEHDLINYSGTIFALDRRDSSFDTIFNVEGYSDGIQTIGVGHIDIWDAHNYAASYNDLALAFRTNSDAATLHYLNSGFVEGRVVNFDAAQYLANYSDLQATFGGNLAAARTHFLTAGVDEHRLPNDPLDYIASFADLISAFDGLSLGQTISAGLSHYHSSGFTENRRGEIDFNVWQYMTNYADVQSAFGTNDNMAAWHFINSGHGEGRLWEDPLEYVASFGDLISAFSGGSADQIRSDGLAHFQGAGFTEGRRAGIGFDVDQYLANYIDLRVAFANGAGGYNEAAAMLHFIQSGFAEGRTDDPFVV